MYASLNEEALTTEERVFVRFTYSDNTTEEVELDKSNYKQINGETCYKFTARVAAADTDKNIGCKLFVGEAVKATYTIKVEDYTAYEKANNAKDSARYKLADALETYGKAARTYFGESTETVMVIDGTAAEAIKSINREGLYYVEVDNIAAADLNKMYNIVIGGFTVNCGALSYVRAAITSDKVNTVNMVKALYLYHAAAAAYFN